MQDSVAVKTHVPCPHCGGHDPATIYSDGHGYCFSCNTRWWEDSRKEYDKEPYERKVIRMVEEFEQGKIREIADRCISEDACKKFGVRTLVKDHKIQKHFYPYYNKSGEKVAEKTRICESKQFFWSGAHHDIQLFGAQCQPTTGKFVVVCEGECFKGDTCVLTRSGWVRLDEWSGQEVMQVTQEGSSFVQPITYINKPYDGDMYRIERNRYSICTTPGHNMVVKDKKGNWKKVKMKDIASQRNIPVFTTYVGPGIGYSDNLLRILVAISADGSIDTRIDGRKYVRISFLKNRKIERMRNLLKAEKIPYHEGVHSNGHTCFCFNCSEAFKEFPMSWLSSLDMRQKLLVIDELQYWDGYKPKTRNQIEYYTTNYNNAVFVQTLASTSGIYGGICVKKYKNPIWSDGYTVRICFDHKCTTVSAKQRVKEHYTGRVYCLQVPSGMLLVRNGKHISVCGNCDAISIWQALGGRYTVVSLPDGCTSFKALKQNYDYLDKFDNIVLCLDGDKAGRDAVEKAVQFLPQKKLKIMRLPEDLKDPNAFLIAGKTQELVNHFWRAEPYTPKDIINISTMFGRIEEYHKSHPCTPTPWVGLNDMIHGTLPGQLVILTGASGAAKSTYMRWWMDHLVQTTDMRIGGFFFEELPEETVMSLMSIKAGKNLKVPEVWKDSSREDIEKWFNLCKADQRIDLYEPTSCTEPEHICNRIRYLVVARDCKVIFLDHLHFLTESSTDPLHAVNKLCNDLAALCVEFGITIIAACHLRKSPNQTTTHEEGNKVTMDDIKGSSAIKQLASTIISVERNGQDPDPIKANTSLIRVLKNRAFGSKGICTAVYYDKDTTLLTEVGTDALDFAGLED